MDAQIYEILVGFPALIVAVWVINLLNKRQEKLEERYHKLVEHEIQEADKSHAG